MDGDRRGEALTIEERIKYPADTKMTVKGKYRAAIIVLSGVRAYTVIGTDEITITLPQIEGYTAPALTRA